MKRSVANNTKLYRIGEVAEILGITKEGVRFLERKQILSSVRDAENGYRYYRRGDIAAVQQIRGYMSAGYSLQDASDMILRQEETDLLIRLEQQKHILEEKIAHLQDMKNLLSLHETIINDAIASNGKEVVRELDGIYYLPVEGTMPMSEDSPQNACISRVEERLWMSATPYTLLGKIPVSQSGRILTAKGICVEEKKLPLVGLPLPAQAAYYPPGKYYVRFIEKRLGEDLRYADLFQEASGRYEIMGDMVSIVLLTTCRNRTRVTINMVRIPIR